jgi:hypothetical protein
MVGYARSYPLRETLQNVDRVRASDRFEKAVLHPPYAYRIRKCSWHHPRSMVKLVLTLAADDGFEKWSATTISAKSDASVSLG